MCAAPSRVRSTSDHERVPPSPVMSAPSTRMHLARRPGRRSFQRRRSFRRRKDLVARPRSALLRASEAPQTTSAPLLRADSTLLTSVRSSFVGRCSPPSGVARAFDGGRTSSHNRDQRSFARRKHLRRREQRASRVSLALPTTEGPRRTAVCRTPSGGRTTRDGVARTSDDGSVTPIAGESARSTPPRSRRRARPARRAAGRGREGRRP